MAFNNEAEALSFQKVYNKTIGSPLLKHYNQSPSDRSERLYFELVDGSFTWDQATGLRTILFASTESRNAFLQLSGLKNLSGISHPEHTASLSLDLKKGLENGLVIPQPPVAPPETPVVAPAVAPSTQAHQFFQPEPIPEHFLELELPLRLLYIIKALLNRSYNGGGSQIAFPAGVTLEALNLSPDLFYHPDFSREPNKSDWLIPFGSQVIYRPNHGFVHSLRSAHLLPVLLTELQQGTSGKADFKKVTARDLKKAMFAMMFTVMGRENEIGFYEAQQNVDKGICTVNTYALAKAHSQKLFQNVTAYAIKNGFTDVFNNLKEVEEFIPLMSMSHSTSDPIAILIRLAHEIDLIRCFSVSQMHRIKKDILPYFGNDQKKLERIFNYNYQLCVVTGNRVTGSSHPLDYNPKQFYQCSQSFRTCIQAMARVAKPSAYTVAIAPAVLNMIKQAPAINHPNQENLAENFKKYLALKLQKGEQLLHTEIALPHGPLNLSEETREFLSLIHRIFSSDTFTIQLYQGEIFLKFSDRIFNLSALLAKAELSHLGTLDSEKQQRYIEMLNNSNDKPIIGSRQITKIEDFEHCNRHMTYFKDHQFTFAELAALNLYTGENIYKKVNALLRNQLSSLRKNPEALRVVIKHTAMLVSALNRAPQRRESVIRRIDIFNGPLIAQQCNSGVALNFSKLITQNHLFIASGLNSTSTTGNAMHDKQVEYHFKNVVGLDISDLSQNYQEKEFLMLPTQMAVTHYEFKQGKHIMTAAMFRSLPVEDSFVVWSDADLTPQLHPQFQKTAKQKPALGDFMIRHSGKYPGFLFTVEYNSGDQIHRYRFVVNRGENDVTESLSLVDFDKKTKEPYIPDLDGADTTFKSINEMLNILAQAITKSYPQISADY
ncbi:SidE phosphodiesterase domain-containing protein [Legionella shakespearei]|uniref:SidE phosphodiesterase domain-containing protein n=1 Tax=Legionella shakespearei TaxID=45075 RepID=UPI0012DD87C6|nr:SidE phosphodiesterase domain-containing protein [Legionella shakespearei]